MKRIVLLWTADLLLSALIACQSRPLNVATDAGLVSGTTNAAGDIRIFRGIPYAAPPVGPLRWREPQPVTPWAGVRRCVAFGPNPIQEGWGGPGKEDCLYLNVWARWGDSSAKRPVMVWIYGGGFTGGSGAGGWCDGEDMARKSVVFVTFNYRVGVFGFLAHPALSAESPNHVSGNYGILDQIAALQWVKRNIAAFGGDPANVTIAGESAGSCSVNTLIASPLAKGLFRHAIAESAGFFKPGRNVTLREAEEDGVRVMRGKNALTLEAMRALSTDSLLRGDYRRLPVVDGYLLPDHIDELFKKGAINKVDLLTGYNEGDNFIEDTMSTAQFISFAHRNYGTRAEDFLALYPVGNLQQSQQALSRDLHFGWEHYTWAKEEGARAFMYYFDRVPPGEPKLGAFHSAEVCYALHTLKYQERPWTSWDTTLSNLMSDYWVNFAFTGDPNGKGLPPWPVFSDVRTQVIRFGDTVETVGLPAMRAFGFFQPYPR
jgi:para-nitrobenzyl esterase